jgi:hypothetical protein
MARLFVLCAVTATHNSQELKVSPETLSPGWLAVLRHQQFLENTLRISPAAHAAEEALTHALDAFAGGDAAADEVDRRFHSRRHNRVRRNRRRERLLAEHVEAAVVPAQAGRVCDATIDAENNELVQLVQEKLDPRQFGLLVRLATGETYAELAVEFGVNETLLRTQACRIRHKAACIAA